MTAPKTYNLYYYDPQRIDLSKLRADAIRRATGDERNAPEPVLIHHHDHDYPCKGRMHERFPMVLHTEPGSKTMEEPVREVFVPDEDQVYS